MGKPSSTRLSVRKSTFNSQTSTSNLSTEDPTNTQDMVRRKNKNRNKTLNRILKNITTTANKKQQRKTQQRVDKLINEFRKNSNTSLAPSQNNSVIVLDDTIQSPVPKKRKFSDCELIEQNKCARTENCESTLTQDDDVLIINNGPCQSMTPRKNINTAPIDCSTPISKPITDSLNQNRTGQVENFNNDVNNLTKEINTDSYLTIDLTSESCTNKTGENSEFNTVIDVDKINDSQDCTFVSASNGSLSLSGESDVTVLRNPKARRTTSSARMNKFVKGISKLDASEKGQLLELITQKIFNGCKVPKKIRKSISGVIKETACQATETAEDTYIKEVILGQKQSRNSIGSNIYNPERDLRNKSGLRMIVIDGSNVAMEHGKGRMFSVRGLQICIDYFLKRGHVVKAFVPRFRCKFGKSTEPRLLDALERRGLVVYTPAREIQGRLVTSYDDRYIVQCAAEFDGVIVSGDNYRDLLKENPRWQFVIENRLLQFTWVNDMIMFPRDPLGRNGPTLEQFLRHPQQNT